MQPSEIDRLSTYEFDNYMELLNKQVKADKEYDLQIARRYGVGGLLGGNSPT